MLRLIVALLVIMVNATTLAFHAPTTGGLRRYTARVEASYDSWADRANAIFEKDTRPVILFDGVCNMCNGGEARLHELCIIS